MLFYSDSRGNQTTTVDKTTETSSESNLYYSMGNKITCLRLLPLPTASNGWMSIIAPINLETSYKRHHHITRPSGKKGSGLLVSVSLGHYEKLHWVKYSKDM